MPIRFWYENIGPPPSIALSPLENVKCNVIINILKKIIVRDVDIPSSIITFPYASNGDESKLEQEEEKVVIPAFTPAPIRHTVEPLSVVSSKLPSPHIPSLSKTTISIE